MDEQKLYGPCMAPTNNTVSCGILVPGSCRVYRWSKKSVVHRCVRHENPYVHGFIPEDECFPVSIRFRHSIRFRQKSFLSSCVRTSIHKGIYCTHNYKTGDYIRSCTSLSTWTVVSDSDSFEKKKTTPLHR